MVTIMKLLPRVKPPLLSLLAVAVMLFLEYQVASNNINGSNEEVLFWVVIVINSFAVLDAGWLGVRKRRELTTPNTVLLVIYVLAIFLATAYIRNNFGGMGADWGG